MDDNVFVIGDVHGNLDRLEALLKQEGLLEWCNSCEGSGEVTVQDARPWSADCGDCRGQGWRRARPEITIVQLGDLGHFGEGGSPSGDMLCYQYVTKHDWCDIVLWGNHDRALVDPQHDFSGFQYPRDGTVLHNLATLHDEGRLQLAFEAHGFLLTHAGLAAHFKQQSVPTHLKNDMTAFVDWINDADENFHTNGEWDDRQAQGVINAISHKRGGGSGVGGILWRDINEGLYDGFRQIFGHSADSKKFQVRYVTKGRHVRKPQENWKHSYCIDIGGKARHGQKGACLAGIWLPSEKIVEVRL